MYDQLHTATAVDGVGAGSSTADGFRPSVPMARPVANSHISAGPVFATPSDAAFAPSCAPIAYAGFGARVGAAVIDFVILQVVSMMINAVFAGMLLSSLNTTTIMAATLGPVLIGGLIAIVYSVWLESSAWQATPGKRILGLKVVDLQGQQLTFGRASLRNLAKTLSMLTLGIGYLMPLWTKHRQALHDSAAGCLVVKST